MLSGVFHLHEQEARQVMTPIPAVVTVDTSEDVETALRRCISSGHTRLLVTEDENQDRVKGIVHSNSLARQLMTEGPQAPIGMLVKDAPIVPETKPLDDLLADLQRNRSSMAVVVDEYGRVAGIVTVEDIIEEVVGEIDDETDPAGGEIRQLANGDWFVRGHVAVTDLTDHGLDLPVDTDAYNSVGGLRLRRARAGCPSAGTPSRPTATRSAWSRCGRTASRRSASGIATRRPPALRPTTTDLRLPGREPLLAFVRHVTSERRRRPQVPGRPFVVCWCPCPWDDAANVGPLAHPWDGGLGGEIQVDRGGSTKHETANGPPTGGPFVVSGRRCTVRGTFARRVCAAYLNVF